MNKRLSPEDAELLLKAMVDGALAAIDQNQWHGLSDDQYEAVKEALLPAIGKVVEEQVGVQF